MSRFEKHGIEFSISFGLDFAGIVSLGIETRDRGYTLHLGIWGEHRQWGKSDDTIGVRSFGLGPFALFVWGAL